MDKNLTDDQQYDERLHKRTGTELSHAINVEIREFIRKFSVPESFSAKAYIIARAEYQYERLFSMSSELGEFGKYVKSQYPHARSMIDSIVATCPSVWVKKGDQYCLSESALLFGKDHKWEDAVMGNSRTITNFWAKKGGRSQEKIGNSKEQVATKLGEMIRGEEERVRTLAEENRNTAEKQRASEEKRRADAELMRADAETKRVKAEEARKAEVQRICTQAQDAAKEALHAAEEAHQAANAIHCSVIESPKQQGTLEMPSGRRKDQPRWENLPEEPKAEKDAIIDFYKALRDAGWQYSFRDIVRFHTSVRCEPLTILGGAPGSGKSSLARMYASYFGLGETKRFLAVDVQPSWHDRMDFLGFVKTHDVAPVFVDAETGVAQFLRDADANPKGLWLACLEEINLARPEHYFSDFLQRISLDDFTRAETPIEFKGLSGNEVDKGFFTLVPSVRFVGTCNFDETTQNFSARFLDRCNYIEFQPRPLNKLFSSNEAKDITEQSSCWKWIPFASVDAFEKEKKEWQEMIIAILSKLSEFNETAEEDIETAEEDINHNSVNRPRNLLKDVGVEPSARTVKGLLRYVCARMSAAIDMGVGSLNLTDNEISKNQKDLLTRAIDEALAQRLFSRLLSSQSVFPGTGLEDIQKSLLVAMGKTCPLCNEFVLRHRNIFF